ncbi:sterol desaturase family protein [Pacificimonas sp. WHA3]|uniref:Sterol desaturase family protein n=1 Tax=Pacificimonas pallii TaxID=2827236 RepID=A0ABS6SA30_9SPHN|nr:sterol desaturase family protein [Pacificimonas pallii]MBV7255223.1 sterol desaturase family protein [Pacificimonas pallii]
MWDKSHHLDKMDFRGLVKAYFQYYAIQGYLLLAAVSIGAAFIYPPTLFQGFAAAGIGVVAYPLVWYLLHRFVLHGKWMYKSPLTARTWKRIHFDHHQDPNHLEVLFGALYTTLPAIAATMIPIGYLIGGAGGIAVAMASGLLMTCFYEFVHCIQHLAYKPKYEFLKKMKARHMAHHFHDETGNFGITDFSWDRLFGTFYERADRPEKSPTVFNLGYDEDEAKRYPWVADQSGGTVEKPERRAKTKQRIEQVEAA